MAHEQNRHSAWLAARIRAGELQMKFDAEGASFIEMVFEALPIFTARSAKEHIVGLQRFGP